MSRRERRDAHPVNQDAGVFNWPLAFFCAAMFASIGGAVVGVARVVGSSMTSRASANREEAYKELAQECALAAGKTAEQLMKATAEIAELRTRTAELERMLKDV